MERPDEAKTATLIGCLERGDEPGQWVLTNARIVPEPGVRGTVGEEPRPEARPDRPGISDKGDMTFALTGVEQADTQAQQHVGAQVRVEGVFIEEPAKRRDDDTELPGTDRPAGTAGEQQYERDRTRVTDRDIDGKLQVKEMQVLAQECPPAQQQQPR